jgi:hypothetical protein
MSADEIYAELRKLAPAVAFEAKVTLDPDFVWDGDGPEPDDMLACDVDISARAIVGGVMLEGSASMGGHYVYDEDDEPGDLNGYLPQMLREAAGALLRQLPSTNPIRLELVVVDEFLKTEMRRRYDEQMAAR